MNSKELEQRLEEFFHPQPESKISSIMVKGPWGVGKTKCLLNFIAKSLKNKSMKARQLKDIAYVSLAGKTSIESINKDLFLNLHTGLYRLRKTLAIANYIGDSAISITSAFFPFVTNFLGFLKIIPTINKLIDQQYTKKNKKDKLVIFDDFERISEKINILDVLGYFGTLLDQNYRLIVIGNTNKFEERFKDFKVNEEKYFDHSYYLDEVSLEIYDEELGLKNPLTSSFYKFLDNNIRYAKLTRNLYKEIKSRYSTKDMDCLNLCSGFEFPSKENELIHICSLIIYCDLNPYIPPKDERKQNFNSLENQFLLEREKDKKKAKELGKTILGKNTPENNNFLDNLLNKDQRIIHAHELLKIYCYIYLFSHGTTDSLEEMIKIKSNPALKEIKFSSPFYLTDNSLEEFMVEIKKWILTYNGDNYEIFSDNLVDYFEGLSYQNSNIPKEIIDKISSFASKKKITYDLGDRLASYKKICTSNNTQFLFFISEAIGIVNSKKQEPLNFEEIKKAISIKDYSNALAIIERARSSTFTKEQVNCIFENFSKDRFLLLPCLKADDSKAYYLSLTCSQLLTRLGFGSQVDLEIDKLKKEYINSPSAQRKLDGIKEGKGEY